MYVLNNQNLWYFTMVFTTCLCSRSKSIIHIHTYLIIVRTYYVNTHAQIHQAITTVINSTRTIVYGLVTILKVQWLT